MCTNAAWHRLAVAMLMVAVLDGCARRVAAPVPGAPAFPEFIFPTVPPGLRTTAEAASVTVGWQHLQSKQFSLATSAFRGALRTAPGFHPARTGLAYVALGEQRHADAIAAFDDALATSADYVPALVGRGLALLGASREDEAITAFAAALARDSSLTELGRRLDVLRFRQVQRLIEGARAARDAGRQDEASAAYRRAIAASPESGFLHRELGAVERSRGDREAALAGYREAVRLDAADAAAWIAIGELLEAAGDLTGADRAYQTALTLEPNPDLAARRAAVSARAREAAVPAPFARIATNRVATRADLAALLGVRAKPVLDAAAKTPQVVTDVSGHWAESWIAAVVQAGVLEPFANHTFQPDSAVRRIELATAAFRTLRISAARSPEARRALAAKPRIADIRAQHPNYPAAAASVAAGVVRLRDGDRFQAAMPVSGAEAQDAVERLRALVLGPEGR
jgi:tetratricopeptide (TPR) repeat protein